MVQSNESLGVIYIATGESFVREAIESAKTVNRNMPDLDICLISDAEIDSTVFDDVISVEDPSYGFYDQIQYMSLSPYDRTLCLDTDIYVDDDVRDVFDLLDRFDIAAAQNHDRNAWELPGIPDSFPEYNTGVVAYKNNSNFNNFIKNWGRYYEEHSKQGRKRNQPSFRKALYDSDIKIGTLPSEYNCMVRYPGHAVGTVKIFHGRLVDIETPGAYELVSIEDAVEKINSTQEHRVFTQIGGTRIYTNKKDSKIGQIVILIQKHGFRYAIDRAIKKYIK